MKTEMFATFNEGSETVSVAAVAQELGNSQIDVLGFYGHTKASEKYVVIEVADGSVRKEWAVPYFYRRTNLFIDDVSSLATYLNAMVGCLKRSSVASFKKNIKSQLSELFGSGSVVTRPIFEKLLNACGEWILNQDFNNVNSQRRIQDIKEMGFTLATKIEGRSTYHMLLPFDKVEAPTYETIPARIRKRIFSALGGISAFTGKPVGMSALPDHKFPEIRWSKDTPVSNDNLTETEMREKFQLVPEFVNQAKREVCRKCFQTGCRGKFAGIDFYYHGEEKWPKNIPPTGKLAKIGCCGCFWYDMSAWREALNQFIKENI